MKKDKSHKYYTSVYYEDTDSGGIVYHTSYLRFAERARTEMLKSLFPEIIQIIRKGNFVFAVKDLKVNYHKAGKLFDDLVIETRLQKMGKTSLILQQIIKKEEKIYCSIQIRLVWLNRILNRPVKMINDISRLYEIKIV